MRIDRRRVTSTQVRDALREQVLGLSGFSSSGLDGLDSDLFPDEFRGRQGIFDTYRVVRSPPFSELIVYVFPFDDAAWRDTLIPQLILFESTMWALWLRWIADPSQVEEDDLKVIPIAPLGLTADTTAELAASLRFSVKDAGPAPLPAYFRPMLPWPNLDERELEPSRWRRLLDALVGEFLAAAWEANPACHGTAPDAAAATDALARRRSQDTWLSDGFHLVPTHWRSFHPQYKQLALETAYLLDGATLTPALPSGGRVHV